MKNKVLHKIDPGIWVWGFFFWFVHYFFFYFGLVFHYIEHKVGRMTTNSKMSCKCRKVEDEGKNCTHTRSFKEMKEKGDDEKKTH